MNDRLPAPGSQRFWLAAAASRDLPPARFDGCDHSAPCRELHDGLLLCTGCGRLVGRVQKERRS
jgi:hypothetical protein